MLIVLSTAKSLDYESIAPTNNYTKPQFMSQSAELIRILRGYSPAEIGKLMSLSDNLAVLNVARYASWEDECTLQNAKQAIFAFNGDVYDGFEASTLNAKSIDYVQDHLRCLSGLHGLLRPLDLMQPYRLEMGTRLQNPKGSSLYSFWDNLITENLNSELKKKKIGFLVNLASKEYFKAVKQSNLKAEIITPVFEDWSEGKFKIVSFHAKRSRGRMARYIIENRLTRPEQLSDFNLDGYEYSKTASTENRPVFRRRPI